MSTTPSPVLKSLALTLEPVHRTMPAHSSPSFYLSMVPSKAAMSQRLVAEALTSISISLCAKSSSRICTSSPKAKKSSNPDLANLEGERPALLRAFGLCLAAGIER